MITCKKTGFTYFNYFIFFMAFYCTTGCGNSKTNDLKTLGLVGKVKSIKEMTYEAVDNGRKLETGKRAAPSWKKDTYRLFDKKGNMVEEYLYRNDGELKYRNTFTYNSNDQKIEELTFKPDSTLWYKYILKYNTEGHLTEKILTKSDDHQISNWLFQYDNHGNKTEENQFFPNRSEPTLKTVYKYDKRGNKVEEYMYNGENTLIAKWLSKYDDKNRIIEEDYYYSDGSLNAKETYNYEFDKKGNWIRQIISEDGTPKFIVLREIIYY